MSSRDTILLRSDDTDASSGVASGPLAAEMVLEARLARTDEVDFLAVSRKRNQAQAAELGELAKRADDVIAVPQKRAL